MGASPALAAHYYSRVGGRWSDVTAALGGGRWSGLWGVGRGERIPLKILIRVRKTAAIGSVYSASLRVRWIGDVTRTDRVKAQVHVVRR